MSMAKDIEEVLIRHSTELRTNTPVDVLAHHMLVSLRTFEESLILRSDHPFFHPDLWTDN